jgi:radical SAM protein with 4Fe4S-binding SPASM domain
MLPKRKKAKLRKEESGCTVIIDKNAFFLNNTAYAVYLLCNGENRPEDIARKVSTYLNVADTAHITQEVTLLVEAFKTHGLLEGSTDKAHPSNFVLPTPMYITWCITKKCNLYCTHCYIDYEPQEVSSDNLMNILEKVKKLNPFFVVLTGGEPLLKKELFVIMDQLKHNSEILLETNGTLLTEVAADKIAECCSLAQVSIYSSSERKHDAFTRTQGSFKKMMEGVALLKERGVTVQFNCVLHRKNIGEIKEIAQVSLSHGDILKFDTLDLLGRGKTLGDIAFSEAEYKNIVQVIDDLAEEVPDRIRIHLPYVHLKNGVYHSDRSICTAATSGLMIDFDGMVKPCEKIPVTVGNLLEEDIVDVWNCKTMNRIRDTKNLKGRCASCIFLEQCRGGCRGEAYLRRGDLFAEDPICWIDTGVMQ